MTMFRSAFERFDREPKGPEERLQYWASEYVAAVNKISERGATPFRSATAATRGAHFLDALVEVSPEAPAAFDWRVFDASNMYTTLEAARLVIRQAQAQQAESQPYTPDN